MCLPSWIMVGRWDCWRFLGGHLCISKCKRMPKLDLLVSGDILRSPLFSLGSAASHRRPKVDYRSERAHHDRNYRRIVGVALRLVWITRRRYINLPGIYRVTPRLAVVSTITREYFPLFCCVAFFCLLRRLSCMRVWRVFSVAFLFCFHHIGPIC